MFTVKWLNHFLILSLPRSSSTNSLLYICAMLFYIPFTMIHRPLKHHFNLFYKMTCVLGHHTCIWKIMFGHIINTHEIIVYNITMTFWFCSSPSKHWIKSVCNTIALKSVDLAKGHPNFVIFPMKKFDK